MARTNSSQRTDSISIEWRLFQNRFAVLLAVLVMLLIAPAVLDAIGLTLRPLWVRAIMVILFSGTLLAALFAVSRGWVTQIIGILLAAPAIILLGMNALLERNGFIIPSYIFAIVFLGYTVCVSISYLFTASRVSVNTICAAVCTYLLLGVLWAIACSLADILEPGSFAFAITDSGVPGVMRFGGEGSFYSIYYSFVTLTTLGIGDITPVSPIAKMLSAIEAVVGQLYLAVLVARMVALHVTQSSSPAPTGQPKV